MKKIFFNLLLSSSVILFITSCQKNIDKPFLLNEEQSSSNSNAHSENKKKIYISNLDELYAAVNNPDNAGTDVILAPGTYILSAAYPNGGRLELQTDMSLRGQPGQIDAVLIDQSTLPNASFRLTPTVTVAPIRIGRGSNTLEWLSVKGGAVAANPLSVIESDLVGTETHVTVSHVYVDCNGSRTGILFRNRLEEHANRVINATLEYAEIEKAFVNPNSPGAGLALQNRISGSKINLNMKGNYIHGCRVGILNFHSGLNNNVENCGLDLISHNDRIEGNGCGLDLVGGTSAGTITANNNTTTVKMYSASIKDNGQSQLPPNNEAFPSGIIAAGGWNRASHNNLSIGFWGCDISNNNGTDIYAFGYFNPTGPVAGTNNHFELYLYGISANTTIESAASVPSEAAGTNVVNVYH